MPFVERQQVIGNLKSVDQTFAFDDSDGTACDAIERMIAFYPFNDVIFANGGDRTATNIPEMRLQGLHPARLRFAFGVGGENKMNSSSNILADFESYIIRKHDDKTQSVQSGKLSLGAAVKDVQPSSFRARYAPIEDPKIGDGGDGGEEEVYSAGRVYRSIDDYPFGRGNGG